MAGLGRDVKRKLAAVVAALITAGFCLSIYVQSLPELPEAPLDYGRYIPLESGIHERGELYLPPISLDTSSDVPSNSGFGENSGAQTSQTADVGEKTLTLSFVGDCMLASLYGQTHWDSLGGAMNREDPHYFFRYVSSYFLSDDWTVANCENVFTDRALLPVEKGYTPAYWYRSATKNAGIFKVAGIDAVSLSNNHAGDYGTEGYRDTVQALYRAGVDVGDSGKPTYFEKYGFRIGLVCANLYGSGQTEGVLRQVREVKTQCDYTIVYFHGGTERIHEVESWKQTACRRIVDEGADLVLGAHPHVLQKMEIYKGKPIVYSLGNFLFGGGRDQENRTMIFQMKLTVEQGTLKSTAYDVIPCYVYATKDQSTAECWIPKPIENEEQIRRVLAFLRGETDSPL